MPTKWILLAALLYLLPLVLAYFAAPRGQPSPATALFRVPVALALDLALVAVFSTVLSVAWATLAAKIVEVVLFVVLRLRGGRVAHDPRAAGAALAAAGLAISAYVGLSWHFDIWDRKWHDPLVASLEGQNLPFHNVYNTAGLPYHLGGDLIAAQVRALSFDHLSSAAALALTHDVFIGLGIAWLVLFARALGARTVVVPALGALALAFHGAIPRWIGPLGRDEPFFPFAQLSYRPHVPIAFAGGIMFVGALVARMTAPDLRGARRALLASTFVLATVDEASLGAYGLALGLTWLVVPRILGRDRREGAKILGILFACVVIANLFVTRTIGHGSAVRSALWVSPRWAGMEGIETPLFSGAGVQLGLTWLAAPVVALIAISASRLRGTHGAPRGALVFGWATFVVSCTLGACLMVNGSAGEAQRFYVAPFIAPLTCLVLLAPRLVPSHQVGAGFVLGVPAITSVYANADLAARFRFSEFTAGPHESTMPYDLYTVDCADVAPTRFGEAPQRVYVDLSGFHLYGSCRSLWVPGREHAGWRIAMDVESTNATRRDWVGKFTTEDHAVAACWRTRASDEVCSELKARGLCKPSDRMFVECELPLPPLQRAP
jgi:hypothetical protein